MKLRDYIAEHHGGVDSRFAKLIGVSPSTVMRWGDGKNIPSLKTMVRIKEVTNGAVTFADFYE